MAISARRRLKLRSRTRRQKGGIPKWLLYLASIGSEINFDSKVNTSTLMPLQFTGVHQPELNFKRPAANGNANNNSGGDNATSAAVNSSNITDLSTEISKYHPLLNGQAGLNSYGPILLTMPYCKRLNPLKNYYIWIPIIPSKLGLSDTIRENLKSPVYSKWIYAAEISYWNIYCTGNPEQKVSYFEGYTEADAALLKRELDTKKITVPGTLALGQSPLFLIAMAHSLSLPDYNSGQWRKWSCLGRAMGLNIPLEDPRNEPDYNKRVGNFRNTPNIIFRDIIEHKMVAHGIHPNVILKDAWKGSTLACK